MLGHYSAGIRVIATRIVTIYSLLQIFLNVWPGFAILWIHLCPTRTGFFSHDALPTADLFAARDLNWINRKLRAGIAQYFSHY